MINAGSKPSSKPLVSVIIPTFNRAETLRECLSALSLQDFPPGDFEIVVVDDGSSDHTAEIVRQARPGPEIHYIHQDNSGPSAARNRGVRHARGEYILIINDDAVAFRNLVSGHYAMHGKINCGAPLAIVGTREYCNEDKLKVLNFLYDQVPFSMRVYAMREGFCPPPYFVTFNISMRKCDFEATGGFDEDFSTAIGEDTELGGRWESFGGKLLFAPRLRAHHLHDVTVDGLKSMIIRESFNRLILVHKQPDLWKPMEIFRLPEYAMREYVEKMNHPMQRLEAAMRECEGLSIWDLEGREFVGAWVDCITDFVVGIRKIYPQFSDYVTLQHYLSDPQARRTVALWQDPDGMQPLRAGSPGIGGAVIRPS